MSASSNRGAGVATNASGTTASAMRARPSRVGRRVAAAFAAPASLEPPHRADVGCHERLSSALIDAPSRRARAVECAATPTDDSHTSRCHHGPLRKL